MNSTTTISPIKMRPENSSNGLDELAVPPHDLEAERCVLGCLMLDNSSWAEVSPIVEAGHFRSDANRRIFAAFVSMYADQGGGVDAVTLRNELDRRGELADVGGVKYLTTILETVPHTAHAEYYAGIVRAKSDQRRAIEATRWATHQLGLPGADTSTIVSGLEGRLQAVGAGSMSARTFAGLTYGELLAKNIPPVEWLVKGVLITQETCAVIAPSKALKTTILIDLAVSLATATPFMGHEKFEVPVKRRVLLLLGETPEVSARSMLNRACEVRGIDPQDIADTIRVHCGGLPSLANDADLQILKRDVTDFGADVTILDPLYLASAGLEMSQLNQVGPRIRAIGDACKPGTLLIAHHATKGEARQTGTTLRLESGSGAGIAESVGQWFILNREAEFDPESDEWHLLNAAYGGRGGHGGRLSVKFKESTGEFDVNPLGSREDTRQEAREERERQQAARKSANRETQMNSARNLILGVLTKSSTPHSARGIASRLKALAGVNLPSQEILRDVIDAMRDDLTLLPCEFKTPADKRRLPGFIHRDDRQRFDGQDWVTILADDPTAGSVPATSDSPPDLD